MKPRTIIAAGVLGLALAAMLLPISYVASPEWDVHVVDEKGTPLQGVTVRLSYRNYSAELLDHEMDATTNTQGRVHFPMQRERVNGISYIIHTLGSTTAGVHASFGRHATVLAFGRGLQGVPAARGSVLDWTGSPDRLESRIVATVW